MSELVTRAGESTFADPPADLGSEVASPAALPLSERRTALDAPAPVDAGAVTRHPALFLEPRAWTVHAVRQLVARGVPVVVLAASRLEPACSVRGVRRQHLPPLVSRPDRWQASLLELAATLEPRPAVYPCTPAAAELLQRTRRTLDPHYMLAHQRPFDHPAERIAPDTALRDALSRSEAALEVQIVLDGDGRRTGSMVLAWATGAPPDVLVTSVAGNEVVARSEDWLGARHGVGYARLVWSPDRFGRLTLQAASRVPGPGLVLAGMDGVDFAFLAHAAAFGARVAEQRPACRLVRRLACCDTGDPNALEVGARVRFHWRDPLPAAVAFLRSLKRS